VIEPIPADAGYFDATQHTQEEPHMHTNRFNQVALLAGLTLGFVLSGASPLFDGHGVEAKKRERNAGSPGEVVAEAVQGFSNPATVSLGPTDTTAIEVSGFETSLTDVNVRLRNITQPGTDALDILLVGPSGQTAIIFSDVGFNSSANNLTVTLDDQAATQMPTAGPIPNGAFQPTNFQSGDTFSSPPAPVATPPSGSELGVFNGTNPNGTWRLFFRNDEVGGTIGAMIGGWSLEITSDNGVPTANPDSLQAQAGKAVSGPSVLGNDSDPDGDALVAVLAGQPKRGTVTLQPDGSFTYKATKKAKGTDSFTYLARDPGGLSDLATVDIQIKKGKKKKGKK
jgi:hypothetical protein